MVINTSLCVLVCCVGIQSLVWPCWQLTPCSKSSQVVKPRPQVFMASFKLRSKCRNKLLIVTNTATSCLLIAQYKRANADTFMKAWGGVPICEEQWARHSWRFDEHASSDVAFNGVTTIHKLHKGEVNVERKVCLGVKLQQSTVVYSFSFRPLNIKIFQKYFSLCH